MCSGRGWRCGGYAIGALVAWLLVSRRDSIQGANNPRIGGVHRSRW